MLLKVLHAIIGISCIGFFIACYYYLSVASQQASKVMRFFTLKTALAGYLIILIPGFLLIGLTGFLLANQLAIPMTTPWLITDTILLTIVLMGVFFNIVLVYRRLMQPSEPAQSLLSVSLFWHSTNIISMLLLLAIIHDTLYKIPFWKYVIT